MDVLGTKEPTTRAFDDVSALRQRVYANVRQSSQDHYPIENTQYRVELGDVDYDQPEPAGLERQKRAIIGGKTMHRSLSGTWRMIDKATGQVIDERRSRVAMVPHVSDRGTFIYRGNEYTLANQMRLKPGVYTRKKETGELESHFNIMPGSGPGFRVFMDAESGVFHVRVGQSKFPLYTLLRSLGVTNEQLSKAWGRDLLASNSLQDNVRHLDKAWAKFTQRRAALGDGERSPDDPVNKVRDLQETFAKMQLDPEVTQETLGERYTNVTPEAILKATQKLVAISQGTGDTDDRDNIAYQTVMGPEDLISERVRKDAGRTTRNLLWRATFRRSLDPLVNTDARTRQLQSALLDSGLGMPLEEVNPIDIHDQLQRISRMGAGGIPSMDAIPDESRAVQPSYLGFIDPIRTSESGKAGVDNRLAYKTVKGDDGQLYTPMLDKAGRTRLVSSMDAARSVIAFPGEVEKARDEERPARAMVRGRLKFVDPEQVDYQVPSHEDMMSSPAHLVPFLSAIKGHRMLMTSRMLTQALAMQKPEAPLVQTARLGDDGDDSFERHFGSRMGVVRSGAAGVVKKIAKDHIAIQTPKGVTRYDLYTNFPFNRKSFVHSTPLVSPGQQVQPGQLLAKSNFTDDEGTLAIGKNLRVGYLPFKGMTYEDAIVISEGAAKKLTSEHMYQHDVDLEPGERVAKRSFLAKFPAKYPRVIMDQFDDNGVIKPGSIVKKDDPLVLSLTKRQPKGQGVLHRLAKDRWMNTTRTWEHDVSGVVTDVHRGPRTVNVVVKSYHPMQVGDKLSNRFASKGVVSRVVPDDQMPRDAEGNPLQVLIHPFGVISRTNPALMLEAALGKVAARTGQPYKVSGFSDVNMLEFVQHELKKHGMSDTEDLHDPVRNAKIPKVFVGNQFFMKLHHTAESKLSGRGDEAGYTADMVPGRQKGQSAKRLGNLETTSLLSAGATEVLRDAKLIRGQRNDDFWRAFRLGYPPPTPEVPFVYRKFLDDLKAAGINVKKSGNYVHIMALTDKDIDQLSRGPVTSPEMLNFDTMNPLPGGLFDMARTGGHSGTGWSHIDLHEPLPNPVMEDPIRRLLGLTVKQYREVLSGQREVGGGGTGGQAIKRALEAIDVPKQIETQKQLIRSGAKSKRDDAVKRLRTLTMFEKTGIKPAELVLSKIPVLPPQYRPIVKQSTRTAIAHPNYLYKELMLANNNLRDLSDELGPDSVGDERLALYDTFRSLTGFSDPIQPKLQEKNVRGILAHSLGLRSSPKFSAFQRKVIGTSSDLVGRAVITPNPSLDMDHVGLPEEKAWVLYRPFIMRDLVRRGMPAMRAAQLIADEDPKARESLLREMERRPVIINRAPTLHRYGIMAAYPVLTKGKTLQVPPITTGGFGADFDGDAEQFHVPVSDEAVQESIDKLMPSRNLLNVRSFDVHYLPGQEFLHGLYEATGKPSDKQVRVFQSAGDVRRAYRRGEINASDRVKVMG